MLDPPPKVSPAALLPPSLPHVGAVDVNPTPPVSTVPLPWHAPSPPPVSSTCQRSSNGVRLGILITDSSRQTVGGASQTIVQETSAAVPTEPKP